MLSDSKEFGLWRNRILFVSACAWVCLLAGTFASGMKFDMAGMSESHSSHAMPASMLEINPRASMAVGWLLMLVAMMAPTLIAPLWHIRTRSFSYRRLRSCGLFVFGYAAVWMAVGALFFTADAELKIVRGQSLWPAAGLALCALIWQASPVKQRCLNRCHRHGSFTAFGVSADVDAVRFGISHGVWCVGSCWALMLFPLVLPQGHLIAMMAVSILMFAERLEKPASPAWRFRGLGKASRILLEHSRPYLQKLVAS